MSATWSRSEYASIVIAKRRSDSDCSLLVAITGPNCLHTSYRSAIRQPNIARNSLFFGHKIQTGCAETTAVKPGCRQSATNASLQLLNIKFRACSTSETERSGDICTSSLKPQVYMQRSMSRKPESRIASHAISFTCASSITKSRNGDAVWYSNGSCFWEQIYVFASLRWLFVVAVPGGSLCTIFLMRTFTAK